MKNQDRTKNVAVDASEYNLTEETLRQEQNRAQQYLDIAAVIMLVLDKDGKITLLNRKGYEILQYPEGTLLGKSWFDTCVFDKGCGSSTAG